MTFVSADEWNRSAARRAYAESSCPLSRLVAFIETERVGGADDGVVLVAHFELGGDLDGMVCESLGQAAELMDQKFGDAWAPSGNEPAIFFHGELPELEAQLAA